MSLTGGQFAQWNEQIGHVVQHVGSRQFPLQLHAAVQGCFPFDTCTIFAYRGYEIPRDLYTSLPHERAIKLINDYRGGPFLLDPFFEAVNKGARNGVAALRRLAAGFDDSAYARIFFAPAGFADQIGLFAGLGNGTTLVMSFIRQPGGPAFGPAELDHLRQVEPLVRALLRSHWSGDQRGSSLEGGIDATANDSFARSALDEIGLGTLSAREMEVVALILHGHSAETVGELLGISAGTVKIHRRNIYRKLQISSQIELFRLLVDTTVYKMQSLVGRR